MQVYRALLLLAFFVGAAFLFAGEIRSEEASGTKHLSPGAAKIDELRFPPLQWKVPEVGREVTRYVLPCGMTVFLKEDRSLPLIKAKFIIRTGALYEKSPQRGLAGFTAVLVRTGGTASRKPGYIDDEIALLGAKVHSEAYYESGELSLETLSRNFDRAFPLMVDMLLHPAFDSEKINLEKNLIKGSVIRKNDSPGLIALREFRKLLFPLHPYGWKEDTDWDTVKNFTREDLIGWHRACYRPGSLYLAISGDFSKDEMEKRLASTFPEKEAVSAPLPVAADLTSPAGHAIYLVDREISQSLIYTGHRGVDRYSPDRPALEVMNFILGGGSFTSRLMQKVRSDEGLAYSVYSNFVSDMAKGGFFLAFCQTKADTTGKALGLIFAEIKRIRELPVTPAELKRAQDYLINSFLFGFEDSSAITEKLALLEFRAMPKDYFKTYCDRIKAVTASDVERVAKQYLHPDEVITVVVGDRKRLEGQLKEYGEVKAIKIEEFRE
ncbi:MAG: M16 family metallopeptidase [Vulcanimicrobiota bacterium]